MGPRARPALISLRSAALTALLAAALAAGCGGTTSPAPTGTSGAGPTSTSASPGAADPGAARLAAMIQALGAGYDFDATVKVGGTTATEAKGRWVGGASQFVLTSSGRSVTYRSVPPNAWVLQGDGTWVATQGPLPSGDPLAVFTTPLTVSSLPVPSGSTSPSGVAGASGATGLDLSATYAAAALGLSGTDPIAVTIHLGADGSMAVTYATTTAAGAATSTTTIQPGTDRSPILAPGASPSPSA